MRFKKIASSNNVRRSSQWYGKVFYTFLYHKKGVTLAELLLAVAIMAFILIALLLVFINCIILNESNRNLTVATSHAQFVMEQIKDSSLTDFTGLAGRINSGTWDWNTAAITAQGLAALPNEAIDTNVAGTTTLDISLTVTWLDRGTRPRTQTLRTLIAEP